MAETPLISETRWKRKPVKRRDSPIANNAFIVTTSLSLAKPDAEARKLIRRHVMLGKNRRASTSPGRQRATPTSWINGGHGSSYHHPQTLRDAADPAEHTFPKINLPRKIGSELALVRFADDMTHNDLELIFKFFTVMKKEMYPINLCMTFDPTNSIWFEYLGRDAAYVHSILFATRAYFDWLGGRTCGREGLAHLTKTLELLRGTLEDESEAISETTISVIVGLAMAADCFGDRVAAARHVQGLHKIIMMRGGLGSLSKNSQLQIKSCRADLGVAMSTGCKPLFFSTGISWKSYLGPSNHVPHHTNLHDIITTPDPRLVNIWVDMKEFCKAANIAFITGHKLDPELFQEVMTSIQYRLLHLGYDHAAGRDDALHEALRLSMLAFASTVFLKIQGLVLHFDILGARLKAAILALERPKDKAGREMMLWILVMTGISTFHGVDDDWLTDYFAGKDPLPWKEARDVLKGRLWIDCLHDNPGEAAYYLVS